MLHWLSSPRKRRRALWASVVALLAGVVAWIIVFTPPAGLPVPDHVLTGEAEVIRAPRKVALTPASRRRADETIRRFVEAAVLREDPETAWRLAAPELRVGTSLENWREGTLPVQPYPARLDNLSWKLLDSYDTHLELDVLMFARAGAELGALVVAAELEPSARGWLVRYWFPRTGLAVPRSDADRKATPIPTEPTRDTTKARLGRAYFLVPAAILSLIVLVPLAVLAAGWVRGRRAERRYRSSS